MVRVGPAVASRRGDEYIVSADEDNEAADVVLLVVGGGGGGSSPFGSDDCSGASLMSSSSPLSLVGYCSDDGKTFHAPPPCQRAMAAFDLGDGMLRQQAHVVADAMLVASTPEQYLSLSMTR